MSAYRRAFALVAAASVTALVACGGGPSDEPSPSFAGTDGAALYAQACASCHGTNLQGTDQGPPFLDAIYRPGHHADPSFLLAVRRGARSHHWDFGDMPPVEGLSDGQVAAILDFVRAEQRAAGIE